MPFGPCWLQGPKMKMDFPQLGEDNFMQWSTDFKAYVAFKRLGAAFTEGIIPDNDTEVRAKAALQPSVPGHAKYVVANTPTALLAYKSIQALYTANLGPRKVLLRANINDAVMSPTETILGYVNRVNSLAHELIFYGGAITSDDLNRAKLNGLPAKYDTVRIQLSTSSQPLTIPDLVGKLAVIEQEHSTKTDVKTTPVLSVRAETRICHYCHKPGHVIADCRLRQRESSYPRQVPGAACSSPCGARGEISGSSSTRRMGRRMLVPARAAPAQVVPRGLPCSAAPHATWRSLHAPQLRTAVCGMSTLTCLLA